MIVLIHRLTRLMMRLLAAKAWAIRAIQLTCSFLIFIYPDHGCSFLDQVVRTILNRTVLHITLALSLFAKGPCKPSLSLSISTSASMPTRF